MARKVVGAVPLFRGALDPHLTQNVAWAKAYLRTKWHLDPSSRFATTIELHTLGYHWPQTGMGRKLGAAVSAVPPFWRGSCVPI